MKNAGFSAFDRTGDKVDRPHLVNLVEHAGRVFKGERPIYGGIVRKGRHFPRESQASLWIKPAVVPGFPAPNRSGSIGRFVLPLVEKCSTIFPIKAKTKR